MGEHFFAQVKAIHSTEIKTIKVYARYNVEKTALRNNEEEMIEIEVIKFPIDTSLLLTVQSMGSGIPVILFVVSLDMRKVFFVCLNDLIDKVIVPEDPNFYEKESKVINVPVKNEVSRLHEHLVGIKFYAKRIKFYSAFMKFIYQEKELHYLDWSDRDSVLTTLRHFIGIISRFDIWDAQQWRIVQIYYHRILELERGLETEDFDLLYHKVIPLWEGLTTLSRNYEEMCREWFLPTYLAQLTSYPE
ncbi:DUF4365 domain-containing protein [Paenibacillus aceti]|nr:DUF4365 domain-containing protein [Paenibacillus aceti]